MRFRLKIAKLPMFMLQVIAYLILFISGLFFMASPFIALPWLKRAFLFWLEHNISPELYETFFTLGWGTPSSSLLVILIALFVTFIVFPCFMILLFLALLILADGQNPISVITSSRDSTATYDQVQLLEEKIDKLKGDVQDIRNMEGSLETQIINIHNQLNDIK